MADTLWTLKGIRIVERKTNWYRWHCPVRGCKVAYEFTVPAFTEKLAMQHLEAHVRRKKKADALKEQVAGLLKQVETDISPASEQ